MKDKENIQEIIRYILRFLCVTNDEDILDQIGYSSETKEFGKYKLVIIPSGFFDRHILGTPRSLPSLPLKTWEETPLLFGKPLTEKIGGTLVIHADIIASTFFLVSRYEETVKRSSRDVHGRFSGKESLPYLAGFLQRPIVDEYGKNLRKLLREAGVHIDEPREQFNKIYLTHDADQLAHYRTIRGMGGAISRFFKSPCQAFKAIRTYTGGIKHDPWYTFPWFFEHANRLKNEKSDAGIQSIVFIKTGGGTLVTDKPVHNIKSKDFGNLFRLCKENEVALGLHPSYQAGIDTHLIVDEKKILDDTLNQNTIYTRNHFLCNREPEDMQALIDAGLTDDFTMAYADVSGFRLGTAKAVKWIDPVALQLTSLTLHPLAIMDSTLSDTRYMNLKVDEAFAFSKKIVDEVKKHNGDLVLLWHNTSVEKNNGGYHRDLYLQLINYLKTKL